MNDHLIFRLVAAAMCALIFPVTPMAQEKPVKVPGIGEGPPRAPIPEDLIGDEHVREEAGVNEFTTPSIRKLFEMLDSLGTLSWEKLHRKINDETPSDRVVVSLSLGALIADGFLVVQCEKVEEMEGVGRALLKHAKALGAGTRMSKHTQSLFEHSVKGDWKNLRTELSRTQADVEAEMVQLRDVDIAHLVSLGGWLRAFQIATQAVTDSYQPEKTRQLARRDIVEYYTMSLESLHPSVQGQPHIKKLLEGLRELMPLVDVPEGKLLSLDEARELSHVAAKLARVITAPKSE